MFLTSSERSLANDEKRLKEIIDNTLSQIGILILNILIIDFKYEVIDLKLLMFSHETNVSSKIKEFRRFINISNCWIVKTMYKLRYCLHYEQTRYKSEMKWLDYLSAEYDLTKHEVNRAGNAWNLISKYKAIGYFSLPITSIYISVSTDIIASILHDLNTYNTLVTLVNNTHNVSNITNGTYKR